MASWVEHASQRLTEAGYRRGEARRRVLELLDGQPCALSVQELEERLGGEVGRASIYRVLDELERLRLVTKLELGQGVARYEAIRPDGHDHHHHLVCDGCGAVTPFADEDLERAIHRVADRVAFTVAAHDLSLRGLCERCARR